MRNPLAGKQWLKSNLFWAGFGSVATGLLVVLGHAANVGQIIEFAGIPIPPIVPQREKYSVGWTGVKIQDSFNKLLPTSKIETHLVETDRPPSSDNVLLKNVDQDLSAIKQGQKNNTGNFTIALNRALRDKMPVCLKIYGNRIPEKSEFKNIIQINKWPDDQNYDRLTSDQRDDVCRKQEVLPLTIIVYPKQ